MLSAHYRTLVACCFIAVGCTDSRKNAGVHADAGMSPADSGTASDAGSVILDPPAIDPTPAPAVQLTLKPLDVAYSWGLINAPVQQLILADSAALISLRTIRPEAAGTIERPEVWAVFFDADSVSTIHVGSLGDAEQPTHTQFDWQTGQLTLDLSAGEIVGGVYKDADGTELHYPQAGVGVAAQAQTLAELDDEIKKTSLWFAESRAHPVVAWFKERVDAVKKHIDRLDALVKTIAAQSDSALKLYSQFPVSTRFPYPGEPDDYARLAEELRARARAQTPKTNYLPTEVDERDPSSEMLVESSWDPARVRCLKEFRSGEYLARIEQTCVLSAEDCATAGGTTFSGTPGSCSKWCESEDNLKPLLLYGGDNAFCSDAQCVDQLSSASATFTPLTRSQCCARGVTEACGATQADAGVVGGSDCLSGTWKQYPNSCKSGGSSITLSFNGSTTTGRGAFTNPECTGQCDPIIFKYTYSVKGKTVTFDYDKTADPVTCSALGTTITPTPPQAPDVMDFSCSGGVLSTMTSLGNVDYKRP